MAVAAIAWGIASSGSDSELIKQKDERIATLEKELAARQTPRQERRARNQQARQAQQPQTLEIQPEAQGADRNELMRQRIMQAVAERLNLTEEQQAQITARFEANRARMEETRDKMMNLVQELRTAQENGTDTTAIEMQLTQLRDETRQFFEGERDAMMEILTPEQQQEAQNMMQEMQGRRGGPGGQGGPGVPGGPGGF